MIRTFLSEPPALMALEFLVVSCALHGGVAAGAGERELHGAAEELEALDVIDSLLGALNRVKDYERLAFSLKIGLGHDVDNVAILGEEFRQGLGELWDLDRLLEVADIHARKLVKRTDVSECNDTYVAFGGGLAAGADMMEFRYFCLVVGVLI
jgi:hypothetical protein